jgi:hypothetical protein
MEISLKQHTITPLKGETQRGFLDDSPFGKSQSKNPPENGGKVAVLTGLEPATSGVTGRHSKPTELQHQNGGRNRA